MLKKIIIAFFILIALAGAIVQYLYMTDNTPISHHWEGYESWYKSTGSEPITGDETRFLGGKHEGNEGYRVIYINGIGEPINKGARPYVYPEGTVIVKEQYADKESFESKSKPELTIMIKLAEGESVETGDWGYVAGFRRTINKGTSSTAIFCGDCHKGANLKKNDFVFINSSSFIKK